MLMAVEAPLRPEVAEPRAAFASLLQVAGDYLALLKPKIILLLVVTELSAMIVAARGWPRPEVLIGALLGGAMAAGGAGAVNCWFDRDIDKLMPRTRKRAIAAGRIAPADGLGFGITVGLSGVALIALTTNALAAALALAGGLVYVFVYTVWLKRSTTQNIVIGGAAGAFPPLVGWAAVTGSLSVLAWVLFAIIFFWTPPHFWALALLLSKQYSAAKVPMLPAVVGEAQTRRSILFYTVLLFAISLVPLVWLGPIYAAAAIGRDGASALALFHYSLAYLALLFIAAAIAAAVRL
jgi:protoheme IX farnesyltransferase